VDLVHYQPKRSTFLKRGTPAEYPICGGAMHVIGEDRSQRLDVIPAQYRVLVTRRPKYACRTCQEAIVQAPAPARLIEGGLPTERMVAHVLVAKYADHSPLYRQAQILARQGIEIDRATLAFWIGYGAAEVKPLWRLMRDELLRSTKLFVDETRAPVLDPGRGRTKTGYLWVIARADRPGQGGAPPAVVYNYAPGRGAEHAVALLKEFTGVLQTDGYAAYRRLADPKRNSRPVNLAYCWAHCRRQFFELTKSAPAPIATEAVRRIAELYEIEAEIRGRDADERRAVRQPLVEALKTWLEKTLTQVPGGSNTAKAIRYALRQWDGLIRFLDDGRIEVDSNTVERAMRPIALTRKNALFAGSDEGAENWAMLASLIETCKLHGVNPEAYFTDVLTKLVNNWPNNRIAELLPWAWTAEAH
jgi:transposase